MGLEAVWLKNGNEVFWVDPVIEVRGNANDPNSVAVFNGYYWYTTADVADGADEFLIRPRKEQK